MAIVHPGSELVASGLDEATLNASPLGSLPKITKTQYLELREAKGTHHFMGLVQENDATFSYADIIRTNKPWGRDFRQVVATSAFNSLKEPSPCPDHTSGYLIEIHGVASDTFGPKFPESAVRIYHCDKSVAELFHARAEALLDRNFSPAAIAGDLYELADRLGVAEVRYSAAS